MPDTLQLNSKPALAIEHDGHEMKSRLEPILQRDAVAVRPSSQLVKLVLWAALFGLVAAVWSPMILPLLTLVAVLAAIVLVDWAASRSDPQPHLDRSLPRRLVKGRPATVVYRLSRPGKSQTTVSILDELPADLGGDLVIEGIQLRAGQTHEIVRDLMPLARGTRESGPTRILWRSRLGLLQFRATVFARGNVAILPAAAAGRRTGLTQRSLRDEARPAAASGAGRRN